MGIVLKNNVETTLSDSISSTDTTIPVSDTDNFPTLGVGEWFYCTIESTTGAYEIVKVTQVNASSLLVTRGQENTIAIPFSTGARVELRVTVQALDDFFSSIVTSEIGTQVDDAIAALTFLEAADIGVTVQGYDADLASWAAITRASGFDTFVTTPSGANLASLLTTALPASKGGTGLTSLSANVVSLLGAADYSAMRTQLSLGTAALKNTSTSGNNVPLLDGANTWSANQTLTNTGNYPQWLLQRLDTHGSGAYVGVVNYYGRDSIGTATQYGYSSVYATTATDGAEESEFRWAVTTAGTTVERLNLNGSSLHPATNGALSLGVAGGLWNALALSSAASVSWNVDTYLYRDAASTIAQRNSTTAQIKRIYRTYTDSSNYERLAFQSGAGYFEVAAESAGTGTANIDLRLTPKGTGNVKLGVFTLDGDQTVGVGQDNYVLTYDNATGLISLEAPSGGGGGLLAANNLSDVASASTSRTNLGLAIGSNVQAWDADLDSWAAITRASGFDTFVATPSSANLKALITDETGSGALVFGTSPTISTALTLTGATETTSNPVLNATQTWNAGAVAFTALKLNITNTASASTSKLLDLQVGGSSVLYIDRAGKAWVQSCDPTVDNSVTLGANNYWNGLNLGGRGGGNQFTGNSFGLPNSGSPDVIINRDAAQTLARRNGTSAQIDRLYRTYTDSSNYERLAFQSGSGYFEVAVESAGTGTANMDLRLTPKGTGIIQAYAILARAAVSTETTGSLTSASCNKIVQCSGNVTLPSSGYTDGDTILIDPRGTARTITRPGAHTMYIAGTDSATGTTNAHHPVTAMYHGSSKWTLQGQGLS